MVIAEMLLGHGTSDSDFELQCSTLLEYVQPMLLMGRASHSVMHNDICEHDIEWNEHHRGDLNAGLCSWRCNVTTIIIIIINIIIGIINIIIIIIMLLIHSESGTIIINSHAASLSNRAN